MPDDFFEQIVTESLKVPARVLREVFAGVASYEDRAELGSVRAPTLLVWGEADALFDRGAQDRLLAALPDARLRVHPDTGHCPNWERPAEVAADLVDFLTAEPAGLSRRG